MTPGASAWKPLFVGMILAAVACVALVVLIRRGDSTGPVEPESAPAKTEATNPGVAGAVRESVPAQATETGEDFLKRYWGDDYPRIQAELRKLEGWEDYDFSKLRPPVPLEEALPELRTQLVEYRPEFLDSKRRMYLGFGTLDDEAKIQERFGRKKTLTPADFAALRAVAGGAQVVLEASADRLLEARRQARARLFETRDFGLAPYSTSGIEDPRAWKPGMIEATSGGSGGWGASMTLLASDIPGWEDLMAEHRELLEERDRLIREYVSSL